jgi:dTDP-4-dehydrorhamnose 3,5-epimerase
MTKKTVTLKTVLSDEGMIVRGSAGLIDGVALRRAKVLSDERGRLGEIMRADDPCFEKFGQVYFITTYPGVVKAWHYHKKQTDHFYVIKGLVKIALCDQREGSPTCGVVNELFWMCVSETEAYIINVVSDVYDYAEPDEFRADPHDNDIPYNWARKDG